MSCLSHLAGELLARSGNNRRVRNALDPDHETFTGFLVSPILTDDPTPRKVQVTGGSGPHGCSLLVFLSHKRDNQVPEEYLRPAGPKLEYELLPGIMQCESILRAPGQRIFYWAKLFFAVGQITLSNSDLKKETSDSTLLSVLYNPAVPPTGPPHMVLVLMSKHPRNEPLPLPESWSWAPKHLSRVDHPGGICGAGMRFIHRNY
ncbi:hypothetical protein MKZ38_001577 [Zalerion maritima]|uniref:Uncharacterized protein n=1 Tax=Zalerion maritima TaxID=339359 RepID=A0AAD5WTR5_9PEZI|nr:hypothetical protein MKZ38_001577 [Zalerion maritima]